MRVAEKDVRHVLRRKLGHDKFTVETFEIVDVETLHFHSNNNLLQVQAQIGNERREFSFFLKSVDVNSVIYQRYLSVNRIFEKEHAIVSKLIPELQKVSSRKITAECYLSRKLEFIVFENLTLSGYYSCGKLLDLEHASVAVDALATLHAASIVKQETEGVNLGQKYAENLFESLLFSKNDHEKSLMYATDRRARAIARKHFSKIDLNTQDKVFKRVRQTLTNLSQTSSTYYNVITQGDPWGGNILFKYTKGKPVEAILVDFQTTRYTPPAQEMAMFLHIATPDLEFVERHAKDLLELYYERLTQISLEKGIVISRIISKESFLESYEVYREFGICARVFYVVNTRIPKEQVLLADHSPDKFCDLIVGGNEEMTLEAYDTCPEYRRDINEALGEAFKFYKAL